LISLWSTALAALMAATPVTQMPVPPDIRMHLLQLSVPADKYSLEEFNAVTRPVLTCDQARSVARQNHIRLVENSSLQMSQLPRAVQSIIAELPIGKPSRIFGKPDQSFKVLMVCRREAPSRNSDE